VTKKLLIASLMVVLSASTAMAGSNIVINEVLHDPHPDQPPSDPNGDANGDGTRNGSEDEFIEIYNGEVVSVDISGWKVNDAVTTRHVFPEGTTIEPGCGIVVFGGGMPTGSFGNMVVQTASTGFLGFNNSGDTVSLLTSSDALIDQMTYASGASDQSWTRDPDTSGGFVAHTSATGAVGRHSPGTRVDGTHFGGCDPVQVEAESWGAVKSIYR